MPPPFKSCLIVSRYKNQIFHFYGVHIFIYFGLSNIDLSCFIYHAPHNIIIFSRIRDHSFHLFQCVSSLICHSFAEYSSLLVSCNKNLRNFATCVGSSMPPSSFNRSKYAAWGSSAARASCACSHKPSVSTTPG